MQSYLKWVTIFCILAPQWTVSIQLNDSIQKAIEENEKKIQKLQSEIDDNEKYLNFDEAINSTKVYISSLEDKLKQCEEQKKNQSKSQLSHIISAIQEIKSNTDTNKNKLKQNDNLIKSLNDQIDDKKSLLKNFEEQIKKKGLEIEKLKTTLSAYNNTINNNKAQISILQSIIESQNNTIFKNSAQILKLESNITICNESVNKQYAEISRLKTNLESKNSTINKNNADISHLRLTITVFNTTINNNNETIANLESTVNSFNSTIIKKNAEISKLKLEKHNTIVKNSADISKLESIITNWKETVNKKDAEISRLKTTIESNNSTINKNNADISNLKSTITAFNTTVNKNNETIARLKSTINNNNAEISKLKSEKINPRATTPQPRITCPSYNNKSQQEITQLKSEANKQTNEINELKIKLNKSLLNNTNLANSRDENFKKYQSAQNGLESCQGYLESLRNESIKNIMTIHDLILKAANNQKVLDQCQAEKNSTQHNLDRYKNSYECFYKRSNALQTNLTDLQNELSRCISLKKEINEKLKHTKEDLIECQNQHSNTPSTSLPTSCIGLNAGFQKIQLFNGNHLYVICDNDGWIIIQQRINRLDFSRNWKEYMDGFKETQGEFFIGLENLHLLTKSSRHELYISVTFSWDSYWAKYDDFRVGNSESLYELESIGNYTGNFFDGLRANVHHKFSTYDKKNFNHDCGMGGWWYPANCGSSNLNGPYNNIVWYYGVGTSTIMMIRPYG